MRKSYLRYVSAMAALAWAMIAVPGALAACGFSPKLAKPASWNQQLDGEHIVMVGAEPTTTPSIVGMWHVLFTAKTSNGQAIPDTVIDNALVVWHSDNTEIMNSVRPPQDGNFCMGVWEQTAPSKYSLNHFAWYANSFPNSTHNGIGDPTGPTRFIEKVTLSPDGNHYCGTFKLYAHDSAGKVVQTFTGAITAARITTATVTANLL